MVEHDRHGADSVAKGNWDLLPISSYVSSPKAALSRQGSIADANRHLGVDLAETFTVSPDAVLYIFERTPSG